MRILVWHGWLLDGTGSNVYTAKAAEAWRRQGHEVLLVCQEPRAARIPFVDAVTTAGPWGVDDPEATGVPSGAGSVTVIRPDIGDLLPVFVFDEYEGFTVKTFVELSDRELDEYLQRNVAALRAVASWRRPDVAIAGHVVPGAAVVRRALGGGFVAKVHGSDLEYAVRLQDRYRSLAEEGLSAAGMVVGASDDVLARTVAAVPSVASRIRRVEPGVDVERWRPIPRLAAFHTAATQLEADPETARGRPDSVDLSVAERLEHRDGAGLDALARSYDQRAPDPRAAARLRSLAAHRGPIIGYLGKLIPQKGVERVIEAMALLGPDVRAVIVGFGLFREWLSALVLALQRGDPAAAAWLGEYSPMRLELGPEEVRRAAGIGPRISFTGRLDHRFAPEVVAGMDVLVVPSTLEEAFGMVAAEGAAAGVLPVVARHSSLAEVAMALEGAAGRPGSLSFDPGPRATLRMAGVLERLLDLPSEERRGARAAVREHVAAEWTWSRTAERLLEAAVEARDVPDSVDSAGAGGHVENPR